MTPTARLARLLPADARPDGALLAAFLSARDEAAFAELVRRHGPLVLAACRRLLPNPADAADAFQAAFLVLARRARRLTGSADLGPWLYRVAAWTARNVRRKNARRLARTAPLADTAAPSTSPAAAIDLDAALLALPEKYRAPLVLCHLQGWSRRDAAARLGCPEGTLSSLLARGLTKLKARLPGYESVALAVVPAALSSATVTAAGGRVPSAVAELAAGVLRALWVPKATAATLGVAAVFALGAGVGMSVREAPAVAQVPTAPAPRATAAPPVNDLAALQAEYNKAVDESVVAGLGKEFAALDLRQAENQQARGQKHLAADDLPPDQRAALEAQEKELLRAVERARRELAYQERTVALARRVVELLGERLDARRREQRPAVNGTLATDVWFPDEARDRVAVAARALVEGATDATDRVPVDAWVAAQRGAHVRVQYPRPRRIVRVAGGPDVALDDAIVALPLTRSPGGYVLVRDGDRVVRFSTFPAAAAARFQEALSAAVPAGR